MMRDLVIEMNSMIVKYDLNLRYSPELPVPGPQSEFRFGFSFKLPD
jgi:hypothetical protein